MNVAIGMKRLLLMAASLLVAACATFAPRVYTTEDEAIADRGQPTRRWTNDDGTHTLEYSSQPSGTSNLLITVDSTGVVVRQEDALSAENLARVKVGMTKAEIDHLLGQHRSVQTFPNSGEEVWDWRVPDQGPWLVTLFNVHFIDGTVKRTSYSYIYPRDGGMMMYDPWWYDPFFGPPFYRYGWNYPWGPYPRFHPWYFY